MGTPLYSTDVIPLTSRPTLTVMDDGDYFVILDTSTGKISKILRTDVQKALSISYNNATSGLTATQVQAALDELVVNLGSSDNAITALKGTGWTNENLVDHESRLDTLEADDTTEGSVAKTVKDAVTPIETRLDTTELTLARQGQDLASVKQTLQQGNGATLDFSDIGIVPLDARATGRANPTVEGMTATNIVDGTGIANLGTVTFASVLNHKYFDVLHGTILTGTGSDMTVTNDTGATKDIAVIYLTGVYGFGNEPSEADCAKIFSYFDGTKSIQLPARVRSVGRNLTDIRSNVALKANSRVSLVTEEGRTCWKINNVVINNVITGIFKPDTRYTIFMYGKQTTGGGRFGFLYTDGTYGYSQNFPTSFGLVVHVSTAGKTVQSIVCGFGASGTWWVDVDTFMLHEGAVALPYEPYTDSTLYIADNEEVRSVPAIADEVKVVNGQLVKVQNVSETTLISASVASINTTYWTTLDLVILQLPADAKIGETGQLGRIQMYGYPEIQNPTDSTANNGTVYYGGYFGAGVSRRIILLVTKGTYADVATAKTALAGTVIYYQLATPIITPLTTSGTLQTKPNGTVYFEPYYEGSHQTDAYSQITLPYEGTIESVYGYDEDLVEYLLDSSEYSLTGTTLTITGAEENEVFFVQMSRSEPLAPEMSVNTLNNEQVIADTSNGKFYKLVTTITNGSLVSQTPVEVV